jgi:recombination protein RecA
MVILMILKTPPKRPVTLDVSKLAAAAKKMFGPEAIGVPGKDADFMLHRISHWIDVGRFNLVLGNEAKGIPCGYYIEVSGGEGAGKTTLILKLIALAQQAGVIPWLADVEHSFDSDWAIKQGVDLNNLLTIESAYQEGKRYKVDHVDDSFKKWEALIREAWDMYARPQILVVDSLAALLPKEQLEGDYGERSIGALARALAVNMPKFQTALLETKTACVFVNQIRDLIGVMFGEKEGTPGGRAKNFYFSSRVSVKRTKVEAKGNVPILIRSRIKNKKNKIGVPFKEAELVIDFDKGVI